MTRSPKKPGVAFWATVVVVVVLVGYPLSLGPVLWVYNAVEQPRWFLNSIVAFYRPMLQLMTSEVAIARFYSGYVGWWQRHSL